VEVTWRYLADRAVPGLEEVDEADGTYRRVLRLHHGTAVVELSPADGFIRCALRLADLRDLGSAATRCRRLLHLDADPDGIVDALGSDPLLGPLVRARPGLRVPGSVDPFEAAVRAVVGQQVSVAAARTVAARLVTTYGEPLATPVGSLTHAFPAPAALAEADGLPMPRARVRTVRALAAAVAAGDLRLDPGADLGETTAALHALPGIGPWTASYIALRGLRDPDAFPASDLGIRRALADLGVPDRPSTITGLAERWRPLRSYAAQHLWTFHSAARDGANGDGTEGARRRNARHGTISKHVRRRGHAA
jgi:AraC family transcriptional regulator of adaptative response / DNA-3-methyladenine glycosylase II